MYAQAEERFKALIQKLDDYKKMRNKTDFEKYKRYWMSVLDLTEVECDDPSCVIALKASRFEFHLHRKGRKTYIVDKTPIF